MDQFIFAKRFAATWHFELAQLWVGEAHHPQVSDRPQFEILPRFNLGPHDLWSLNMRYLVEDALQRRSLIRCRCVDGRYVGTSRIWKWIESGSIDGDGPILTHTGVERVGRVYRRWRPGNAAEPRQRRPCRNQNGLWECP